MSRERTTKKKYLKEEECIFVVETGIINYRMLSKSSVKYIQSLYHKKFRDELGVFIAEGPKLASELLSGVPALVQGVYAVKNWLNNSADLLTQVDKSKIFLIEPFELDKISALSTPNQVLLVVKQLSHPVSNEASITLLLDDIQDPGNLGTIIRTADWFGVNRIVCSPATADIYSPKVVQSTMGSILRVRLEYADLADWCRNNNNTNVYATTLYGQNVYECVAEKKMALLIGNESRGVREDLLALSTHKITIPRKGAAESLNAAVAAGIALAHFTK